MELSPSDKERISHQFDTLVKKVLTGKAKNYKTKAAILEANEINFSELPKGVIESLCQFDDHKSDYLVFKIVGFETVIKNELLGEAMTVLPELKRNILLMSFFLELKGTEIATLLNLAESTVTYHKNSAIKELREIMEDLKHNDKRY